MADPTPPEHVVVPAPVELLGLPVHPMSAERLVGALVSWGRGSPQRRVYYANIHAMNLAARDERFRAALKHADIVFCDGFGVKWGARLAGHIIPERMTPPDWIDNFAAACALAGEKVFALGDEPGVAARFQQMLADRHPGYGNAGSHHGFFAKEGPENDRVVELINSSGAAHLLVGFGMPLQELWLERNAARLSPSVLVTVGALFRWYTGRETRAPKWMASHGMEWLARFIRHPVRHFRRYAIGNFAFMFRVIWWRFRPQRTQPSEQDRVP